MFLRLMRPHPDQGLLIARPHWPDVIASAIGDIGAREFLRTHRELVLGDRDLLGCGFGRMWTALELLTNVELDVADDFHEAVAPF